MQTTLPACLSGDAAWGAMVAIVRLSANMVMMMDNESVEQNKTPGAQTETTMG